MESPIPIQIGPVEEENLEIIDLIHSFKLSADFAHWITEGRFIQKILQDHLVNGKYTRIFQYHLDGVVFFNGTKEIYLDKMNKAMFDNIVKNRTPFYEDDLFFSQVQKTNLSNVIAEPYYNMISHLYMMGQHVGTSWEIYELSRLVRIYQQKDDPIRYWRKNRRE